MDRWIDADDDIPAKSRGKPQGRVAALGMAGFVKSQGTMGAENAQTFGKIEVVQSKREQRKAEATRLMPPPKLLTTPTSAEAAATAATTPAGLPPVQSIPAAGGPPKCPVPDWAAEPPAGSRLLVYKDGQVIQEIALAKVVTVFGRVDALADVVLDHPSVSRQHATAAFHPGRAAWLVTDLGSTHGTFVGERQLGKHEPTELPPGTELRFAASTRRYKLPPPPPSSSGGAAAARAAAAAGAASAPAGAAAGAAEAAGGRGDMPPPPPPKRARVCFADDAGGDCSGGGAAVGTGPQAAAAAAVAAAGRPRQLETVIGFSDGREFAARVGPRAAAPAEGGRFAAAVASTTMVVSPKAPASASAAGGAGGGGGDSGALGSPRPSGGGGGGSAAAGAAAVVQPQLKDFVERMRKEPPRVGGYGSLYEQLPPPSR
ncbi:hypothetical protein PLESTB_001170000 [Pleodorina starrii]|uniref:FHA domain-containing protein n=1 Tax=Pleodorina starrii TaxID=330485 RepID=A0A9W6BS66_9CHLO|nr:hypothetical protein PLESTB_001170000 [Pleodorina starrii]GLC64814.1 hypothetical protein PLESTF_000210300 [Pleodorina starrii]